MSSELVRTIKLVLASPSDVLEERNIVQQVVGEVNRFLSQRGLGTTIEVFAAEGIPPGFHRLGPQGHIDSYLPLDDCDILLGIFWWRFGTLGQDGQTGTEHEIRKAYDSWMRKGRPQIMLYFNEKPYFPGSSSEAQQWVGVWKFREEISGEGFFKPFVGQLAFQRLVFSDLLAHATSLAERPATRPKREGSLSCTALSGAKEVCAEGIAERTAEIELLFEGELPSGLREQERQLTVQVAVNCNITNPVDQDGVTDCLAIIEGQEPVRGLLVSNTRMLFEKIPESLVTATRRGMKITNLRANASSFGVGGRLKADVSIHLTEYPGTAIQVYGSPVTVGSPMSGLLAHFNPDDKIIQLGSELWNKALSESATCETAIDVLLPYSEGFRNAFRSRAEELTTGGGITPVVGTRFMARFFQCPENVDLFVTTSDVPQSEVDRVTRPSKRHRRRRGRLTKRPSALLVIGADEVGYGGTVADLDEARPGSDGPRANGIPLRRVPTDGGFGVAVWEYIRDRPSSTDEPDELNFGVVFAVRSETKRFGYTQAALTLAPLSSAFSADEKESVPRFIDTGGNPTGIASFLADD